MNATVIKGPWHKSRSHQDDASKRGSTLHAAGEPPSAEYLAMRIRLGIPSAGPVLNEPCPWCGSGPFEPCRNPGIGTIRQPHEARQP